jgi:two-component system response regulator NreC
MIRLLLADDHQLITTGISSLLADIEDIEVVEVCQNGQEALTALRNIDIDVLLLDIDMPVMNGLECATQALAEFPELKIAMLSMHDKRAMIEEFIDLGVKGYFLKTVEKEDLVAGLRKIAGGGEFFPAEVVRALLQKKAEPQVPVQSPLLATLSVREVEVLKLIAHGKSNKEAASELFLSPRTVDTHRTNIMRKLEVHNVAGLVRFAFQNGLMK